MKTAFGNVSAVAVLVAILAITRPADAATILVDLGANTLTTGTVDDLTWNNIDAIRGGTPNPADGLAGDPLIDNLVDTAGNQTPISLTAAKLGDDSVVRIGGTGVDVTGSPSVVSPSGIAYPSTAFKDALFTNSRDVPASNYYEVTLGRLDGTKSYDIYFLAAASGGNDNGNAKFTVIGNQTSDQTVANATMVVGATPTDLTNNFLSFVGVVPDENNEITIQFTSTYDVSGTLNSNGRWNTMELVEVPEPASVGFGVVALGSLVGFTWRRRRAAGRRAA